MPIPLPSLDDLSSCIAYNPETGIFINSVTRNNCAKAGDETGCLGPNGYKYIRFRKKLYLAHRLAWLYSTGDDPGAMDVDHINGVTYDNRFCNLRIATRKQNLHNSKTPKNNTSGHKGVSRARGEKWKAQFRIDDKVVVLGEYKTFEEAVSAYTVAVTKVRGEFARF